MANTVQQQIALVEELTTTLQSFLQNYEDNTRNYLAQVRAIGDQNNALREPFQQYMNIQQDAHLKMKALKTSVEEVSIPKLNDWKRKLEELLQQ